MQRFPFVLAAALVALAAPAVAQMSADHAAPAKKAQDPNKMICHTDADTGSRLSSHRECHTAAQWQDIQRQQRADIAQTQNGPQ